MPLPLMTLLRPTPRTLRVGVLLVMVLGPFAARAEDKSAVSPNHIKLPTGPGSLEGVGENAQINYAMGLMNWGMDLEVPQGREGLTPALRLSYSSGAGRSTLGIGWSLGVPSIERMTVHGLPTYNMTDAFSADGSELVYVATVGNERHYRARFEGGFVRYRWVDPMGSDYWVADLPDGTVQYLGADRLGTAVSTAREEGPLGTFRYRVVEVTNPFNELLRYEYLKSQCASLVSRITWVFLNGVPRYELLFRYEDRQDHLVDGKPGFPVTLDKRVDDLVVRANGQQRRRYDFLYESYAFSGGLSRLSGVRTYGMDDAQAYGVAFDFAYTNTLATTCTTVGCFNPSIVRMAGTVGPGLFAGEADLVDMNGDGLPDVLDTSDNSHGVYLNRGGMGAVSLFEPRRAIAGASASLRAPGVRMVDLDGDGFPDLYDALAGVVHHGRGDLGWRTEAAPLTVPDMGPGSNFTFTDFDGDKAIDILYADGSSTYYLKNNAGRFETATTIPAPIDSAYVVELETGVAAGLQLSDMNGDGLGDAVFVNVAGLVAYRANYGRGQFAADITTMTGLSPNAGMGELKLVDVNGDGLGDAVTVRPGAVAVSLNENGQRFLAAVDITGDGTNSVPFGTAAELQVRFADMTGDGSVDVVWVDAQGNVTFLDFYEVRPNLLARITNGIGKIIEITYGTAAGHMARAGGPDAWSRRLPHPMLTIDRADTWDTASGVHSVMDMVYRDGFYDGREQRFRGFEVVTVTDQGDASSEDSRTTLEFDVGVADPYRNVLLTLQRLESGGANGFRVLNETTTTYGDCLVSGVTATVVPVRYVCPTSKQTTILEGLAASQAKTTREEYVYDGYGNRTQLARLGVIAEGGLGCAPCARDAAAFGEACGPQCLGDERYEETLFVPPTATAGRWMLRKPMVATVFGARGSEVVAEQHYHYDGEPFVGLPLGQLTRGLPSRVAARETAAQARFIDTQRTQFGTLGQPLVTLDANGNRRDVEYDAHNLLVTAENVHMTADPQGLRLRTEVVYHPVLDAITRHLLWRRVVGGLPVSPERSVIYAYDAFGRLQSTTAPGDTTQTPTTEYRYQLGDPTSSIETRSRTVSGGAQDLVEVMCFDGRGRTLNTRRLLGQNRVQVENGKRYNRHDKESIRFPTYGATSLSCDEPPPASVAGQTLHYDAAGRPLQVVQPDGELYGAPSVHVTQYLPLGVRAFDENDTAAGAAAYPKEMFMDGLGRTVRHQRVAVAGGPALRTTATYDALGNISGITDALGHTRVQEHDLLGRVVRSTDPDTGTTTHVYDDNGNRTRTTDARGRSEVRTYDALSRPTSTADADNDSTTVRFIYDEVPDCTVGCDAPAQLTGMEFPLGQDRFFYDDRMRTVAKERTLDGKTLRFEYRFDNAGRLAAQTFPTGETFRYSLDGAGRITAVAGLVPEIEYGTDGITRKVVYGNQTQVRYGVDALRRLERIEVVDAQETLLFGQAVTWDRVNNASAVQDLRPDPQGPSTTANFTYDGLRRLVRAELDPGRAGHEETVTYQFDAIDNLTQKTSSLGAASSLHVGSYTYDAAHPRHVRQAGNTALAYDASGNVTRLNTLQFTRDHLGRVTEIRDGDTVWSKLWYDLSTNRIKRERNHVTSYFYDAHVAVHGGLTRITLNLGKHQVATVTSTALAARFLNDAAPAGAPDGAITAADAYASRAQPDDAVDALLTAAALRLATATTGGRSVEYSHHDYLASPVMRQLDDGSAPVMSVFGPHGEQRERSRSTALHAALGTGFLGHDFEDQAGLVHMGARFYSPRLGIFLSPDPMYALFGEDELKTPRATTGRYVFALGNPSSIKDEDGQEAVGAAIGFVVGVLVEYLVQAGADVLKNGWDHSMVKNDPLGFLGEHAGKALINGGTTALQGLFNPAAGPAALAKALLKEGALELLLRLIPEFAVMAAKLFTDDPEKLAAVKLITESIVTLGNATRAAVHVDHAMHKINSQANRMLTAVERSSIPTTLARGAKINRMANVMEFKAWGHGVTEASREMGFLGVGISHYLHDTHAGDHAQGGGDHGGGGDGKTSGGHGKTSTAESKEHH